MFAMYEFKLGAMHRGGGGGARPRAHRSATAVRAGGGRQPAFAHISTNTHKVT